MRRRPRRWKCCRCRCKYDRRDGLLPDGKVDDEWEPRDGYCYQCHLNWLFEIYGRWLEPCFVVNGQCYTADGCHGKAVASAPDIDEPLPF